MSRIIVILLVLCLGLMAQPRLAFAQGDIGTSLQGFGAPPGQAGQNPPPSSSGFGIGPSISQGFGDPGSFSGPQPQAKASALGHLDITFISGDTIIARVGDSAILLSEIFPELHFLIRNPELVNAETLAAVRQRVESDLPGVIQTRLVIKDFERTIPEEGQGPAKKQFIDFFEKTTVPQIMAQAKVASRAELVNKLKENGMSLDQIRSTRVDAMLVQVWLKERTDVDAEKFTREELLEHYNERGEEFDFPSRARFEQITIKKAGRTKAEAYNMLARLGDAVVLRGVPFAQVARDHSEGPTAAQGGAYDWTTQGALVSEPLDKALFTIPVGQPSRIIEDEKAFHIIRVIEREMAGRKPFEEVQLELRVSLKEKLVTEKFNEYMAELKKTIPVVSILDGSLQLQGQAAPRAAATVGDGYLPGQ